MRSPSLFALACLLTLATAAPAAATPVCTDGYQGGPSREQCGGRIFPEAHLAQAYVQYTANPFGFVEYQHGLEYLAREYPRWASLSKLDGQSAGGRDVQVLKLTDHQVPDKGKQTLFFSLSVHGNERGGLEGALRTAEDLAVAAQDGGKIADGVANYESTTGREPAIHEHEVRDLLRKQVVYFVDFNPDGWAVGDLWARPPLPYTRGNANGTDLNRQMPTVGRIDVDRNPLEEPEMRAGHEFMHEVAAAGVGGKMAYGADVHGELTSQAYVDVMYPAGQFDSVDHRRLMAIAERTKSVIDATLYRGIVDEIESATSGNEGQAVSHEIPTKPAHWATVWDTLGYTDTGFIGDYMATDLGVTGMDYEIAYNHTVPDKAWNVYLQENHINATRAIIKTAMAYALFQEEEFNARNVRVDPVGRAGYVADPDTVSDDDENGAGTLPGPEKDGVGADGKPVAQRPYDATNMRWFEDTSRLMPRPFLPLASGDVARDPGVLDQVDSLVLADRPLPDDAADRSVRRAAYFDALGDWVKRGGNLVLTDRALHALPELGLLAPNAVRDIRVYQPYANIRDYEHALVQRLRSNARQLVEAPALGYEIGNDASPMTVVDRAAWEEAGGVTVATTGNGAGSSDDETQASIGELKLGDGKIRIVGGALPRPTEENDHRYGLRDYAMTYTGLFIMENAIRHDVAGLGALRPGAAGSVAKARARVRCVSRRRIRVKVRDPRGRERLRSLTIRVAGKRVARLGGKRLKRAMRRGVLVDLRGKPRGRFRVTIVGRTTRGRTVRLNRRYRTCTPKRVAAEKRKKAKKRRAARRG